MYYFELLKNVHRLAYNNQTLFIHFYRLAAESKLLLREDADDEIMVMLKRAAEKLSTVEELSDIGLVDLKNFESILIDLGLSLSKKEVTYFKISAK